MVWHSIPEWLPIIRALRERGVHDLAQIAAALGYWDVQLASGKRVWGRFPAAIASIADEAGRPLAGVAEQVLGKLAFVAGAAEVAESVTRMAPLLADLPGVCAVGELIPLEASQLTRVARDLATSRGFRLPRLAEPVPAWQELIAKLGAACDASPTSLVVLAAHTWVVLLDGTPVEPCRGEQACESVAAALGGDASEIRHLLYLECLGAAAPLLAAAEQLRSRLALLPGVREARDAPPPVRPPPIRRVAPGEELPLPPWKLFPEPPSSLRWRMGPGEDTMDSWVPLWLGLTRRERSEYLARHPPPDVWVAWLTHFDAA